MHESSSFETYGFNDWRFAAAGSEFDLPPPDWGGAMPEVDVELTAREQNDLQDLLRGIKDPNRREELVFLYKQSARDFRWYQQQRDMSDQ